MNTKGILIVDLSKKMNADEAFERFYSRIEGELFISKFLARKIWMDGLNTAARHIVGAGEVIAPKQN